MKENVGGVELGVRAVAGPALLLAGLTVLGARHGRPAGLAALIWGALVTETAMTRTCSVNGLLGRDSSRPSAGLAP